MFLTRRVIGAAVGLVGGAPVPSVTSRRASLQQEKHPAVTSGRQALGSRDCGAVPTWDPPLLLLLLVRRKVMGSNMAFHQRLAAIKRRRKRCSAATPACQ